MQNGESFNAVMELPFQSKELECLMKVWLVKVLQVKIVKVLSPVYLPLKCWFTVH